jgi:hypothetical protein
MKRSTKQSPRRVADQLDDHATEPRQLFEGRFPRRHRNCVPNGTECDGCSQSWELRGRTVQPTGRLVFGGSVARTFVFPSYSDLLKSK